MYDSMAASSAIRKLEGISPLIQSDDSAKVLKCLVAMSAGSSCQKLVWVMWVTFSPHQYRLREYRVPGHRTIASGIAS